jgi:hypothetical protein
MRSVPVGCLEKTWGIMSTLQEKDTRLTGPVRSLIWVGKAGLMCASATRGPPVCFLSGGGRSPAMAGFFLAVFSAVPGKLPALPRGRPLGLASFFVKVGTPGF